MKIDINDGFALTGGLMLAGGIIIEYGWSIALIVIGSISLFLGVWRTK